MSCKALRIASTARAQHRMHDNHQCATRSERSSSNVGHYIILWKQRGRSRSDTNFERCEDWHQTISSQLSCKPAGFDPLVFSSSGAMFIFVIPLLLGTAQAWPTASPSSPAPAALVSDIGIISKFWGQLSPYSENADSIFGVEHVGLPDGCQIEQAHTLQRHSNRFPTGAFDDGANDSNFGEKVANYTSVNTELVFTGPLTFLNSWTLLFRGTGLLTGLGASSEFQSGVMFWNRE